MREDFKTHHCVIGCDNFGFLEALLEKSRQEGKRVGLLVDLMREKGRHDDIKCLVSEYDNFIVVDAVRRSPVQAHYLELEFSPYCFVEKGGIYLKKT